jgi:hypothetical protein
MRRSIFKAGVWTAFGLAVAFAIVSANSNTRHAATTAAPAAKATVASAITPADDCSSSDVCCAKETKVETAAVAAAPVKKVVAPSTVVGGAAGMVVGIDPESGELTMPSAAQLRELQASGPSQVVVPAEPVETIHFPNGAIGSAAAGEVTFATVHIDATGKKVFDHSEATAPVQPAKPALEEK